MPEVKANASKITYVCKQCGTKYEITVPYYFPDGSKFRWAISDCNVPECIMQYATGSGYPGAHVVHWTKTERIHIESGGSK